MTKEAFKKRMQEQLKIAQAELEEAEAAAFVVNSVQEPDPATMEELAIARQQLLALSEAVQEL